MAEVRSTTAVATEQREQVAVYHDHERGGFIEDTKTEEGTNDLDPFDPDDFLEAMRTEYLFGLVAAEDVNISDESFAVSAESEDEEESAFNEGASDQEVYADEVESDLDFVTKVLFSAR
ncbi:unnamed protein product [Phytophthora lilii]|uniref:Unnamed protein product n=1 Tax=Phytophthora lilii TaxID=2077276 RepID=A0A9W6TP35_9STRA|nr:unnamed protein product [Phytophthora lilii]